MTNKGSFDDSSILNIFNALAKRVSDSAEKGAGESSVLDSSLLAAKEFFARQAAGGLALIESYETLDDFISLKNESMELSFELGLAQTLAGVGVRFFVDSIDVGSSSPGTESKARVQYSSNKPGCFPVTFTLVRKNGHDIANGKANKNVILQVLDRKPVVCVDIDLLCNEKGIVERKLSKLSAKGFDFVYIDFGEEDRVERIRELRIQDVIPMGAIVPLTARIRDFESFDVDFKQSFMGLTVNRLRARGVPVVALMTNLKVDHAHAFPDVEVIKETARMTGEKLNDMEQAAKNFVAIRNKKHRHDQSAIEWRVDQMLPGEWTNKNLCHIQMNNKLARLEIFDAIDSAETRVDLQFYIFKGSRFAHELGVRLIKAVERGVTVRLMVDALWSREGFLGNWNNFLKQLGKSQRVHVLSADSVSFKDDWGVSALRQRDHRKLIVIDGMVAFVGGRNGADEYYYDWSEVPIADWTLAESIPWLDAHVKLQGAVVRQVQDLFNKTWKRNGGKNMPPLALKARKSRSKLNDGSRVRLVTHEGIHDANGLAAYECLICGAKKNLILVNDFPVLDDIAEMLIQAVRRGVKVTFLTGSVLARRADGTFFEGGRHRELFEYVVKSRLGVLVESGVDVYEFQTAELDNIAVRGGKVRPYVHAKLITADGRFASLGSANLDVTASYWERESNALIDDEVLIQSLNRQLGRMIKNGIKLDTTSVEWKREAPQREIVSRLWPDSFLT